MIDSGIAQINPNVVVDAPIAAGDVFFDELFITTLSGLEIDLKNFVIQLQLYEDLFSNVLKGTIIINDALNLLSKAPLVGGEYLSVQFRTPGYDTIPEDIIQKTFAICGISDRMLDNDRQQFYTLHFISIEGLKDNTTILSTSFKGSTDAIITKIYNDKLLSPRWFKGGSFTKVQTSLTVSGTPHSSHVRMVVPYWTPLKTINWVTARAQGKDNKGPNFLFYETNKGFYCASVEDLISNQRNAGAVYGEYFYSHAQIRNNSDGNFTYRRPNVDRQYQIVGQQRFPSYIDILRMQDSGYLASTLYTHDITLKQFKEWGWDYSAQFDTFQHLESYSVSGNQIISQGNGKRPFHSQIVRDPSSYRTLRTKSFRLFDDIGDPKFENWALQRNSLLNELSNIRLELDVMGRTDIEAGQLIYYHYPNSTDKTLNDQAPFDPIMSGLFLITAIRHTFTPGRHSMRLEIVKDSFQTPVG